MNTSDQPTKEFIRLAVRERRGTEWVDVFVAQPDTMENAILVMTFHRMIFDANPKAFEKLKEWFPEVSKAITKIMELPDPVGHEYREPPKDH